MKDISPRGALSERWNRLWGHDLFISYSRRDSLDYARQLDRTLTKAGFHCFRDEERVWAGDHLPSKLRSAVRGSRVLLVLLSPKALESRWVQEEVTAYLGIPGSRQVIPVFFDRSHPDGLPTTFDRLRDYRGLYDTEDRLQRAEPDPEIIKELQQRFAGVRQRTLRRVTLTALALGLGGMALIGTNQLVQARAETTQRQWRERAAGFLQAHRNDLAELALAEAHAAGAATGAEDLRSLYQQARSRRVLVPLRTRAVSLSERLRHWGSWKEEPYAVIYNHESGQLELDFRGARHRLTSCATKPQVASRDVWLVWSCGKVLQRTRLDSPGKLQQVTLDNEPGALDISSQGIRLLAQTGTDVHLRGLHVETLTEQWQQSFSIASPHALLHLCPDADFLAYGFTADRRELHLQRWRRDASDISTETFTLPEGQSPQGHWGITLGTVTQDARCERFILSYAPWLLLLPQSQTLGDRWLLLSPGELRPVLPLEPQLKTPWLLDRRTGSEALYLTTTNDLRRQLVTPPIVRQPDVRTLASRVSAFAAWEVPPGSSSLRILSVGERGLEVHLGDEVVARYPVGVEEAMRIRVSSDGNFIAVEGRERISIWQRAVEAEPAGIPGVEALAEQLGVRVQKDGTLRYLSLPAAPVEEWKPGRPGPTPGQ
jgi:hypothetical protein